MTGPAPECAALAEGLRDVRARTGLSLAALAERTAYSKSSWERYLNGKKPVPRQAVLALCALAQEPTGRLLALWELADAEWSGRARHAPSTSTPSTPAVPPPVPAPAAAGAPSATAVLTATGATGITTAALGKAWHRWLFLLGAGVAALAATAVITALSVQDSGAGQATSLASPVLEPPVGCRGKTCEGKDSGAPTFCSLPDRSEVLGPKHRTRTGAFVQIRYSKVCAAAWGRFWHAKVGDAIEISAPGSPSQREEVADVHDTKAYLFTYMVDASETTGLRVCFDPVGVGRPECFRP
ncbi:helix-turn-helix domain-containing protein [Streptomyces luomodiensis]|uniref:Helix-turn-helix domain-containing protein n=1 Tax=Streptomyces luomodiensis TaxID=3026192 RepID=A0ABY9UNP0_9ACTN|nr:helix-turn-helix domain-containing protein [Streptomyces sp. SCA4-21]WNE94123.1 helix-turn-helix domain-containing protein [Streptomyces sp. SCA4-21]